MDADINTWEHLLTCPIDELLRDLESAHLELAERRRTWVTVTITDEPQPSS